MSLQERMDYYLVPGVSIALINNGQIEWARGFGVAGSGGAVPVTADSVFQAASISKTFAAAAVMLMDQSDLIDVDHEVNSYLTSWKIPDNQYTASQKVLVRHLLSHTGGTTVSGFTGYRYDESVPALLQILDGLPPANSQAIRVEAVPGSRWNYSGGGTEILHLLVQEVSGMTYRQYLNDYILRPLNMMSSDPLQPLLGPLLSRAVSGHDAYGTTYPGRWYTYPELGAAGLWTTPSDLARFALSIQSSALGRTGNLLSPQTVNTMLTSQTSIDGEMNQGLGFMLEGNMFEHSGSNLGFKTLLVAYRDRGQGAAIMTNGDNGTDLINEIMRSISRVYGWPDFKPEEQTLASVPEATLNSYTGRYRQNGGTPVFRIGRTGTGLTLLFEGHSGVAFTLYPVATDRFLVRCSSLTGSITFTTDSEGTVTGFQFTPKSGSGGIAATKLPA
ncbi:MAG: Penicillin-binding protein 4* [Syntrophorhabdaceae bacterium PtaU1.Bin034]|nr:MAG: Penicillin-binding protein 4* [Syntrophorhabdaceae bacterium PtaU1.Bin034]